MDKFADLEPSSVFRFFAEISSIPRGSGNMGAISQYVLDFARERGYAARKDEFSNVVVFCPASPGMEDRPTVMLQGHLDMVCEKSADSRHDFKKDPLDLRQMDDCIYAASTTLGADDGIAVAYALAIMDDRSIVHPPLELVFTADEEVGMVGATGLDTSDLKAKYLLNLDSEREGVFLSSSAGGLRAFLSVPVKYTKKSGEKYSILVSGFQGGHSGGEIDKYRGNANLIMGRLLHFLSVNGVGLDIYSLQGGLMINAIPRDAACRALLATDEDAAKLEKLIPEFEKTIKNEYKATDKNIMIYCDRKGRDEKPVLHKKMQERLIFLLNTLPDGVIRMSQEEATRGLVETSLNMGIMRLTEKSFEIEAALRSSVSTAKYALAEKLRYLVETIGGSYEESGDYPAWEYREDSKIIPFISGLYTEMSGRAAEVSGVHMGVECGIFYEKMPDLDIVSFGPDISGAHTPSERMSIPSAKRTWDLLLRVLKEIK
ncbi:MAG: aminoacyl-histidine dipeptidase [Lachnospiraceae bacterium]|nr:aminoacyl-histidine dipeptidase [Lachnospiraceae bacterium]